jgi:hypothetical protein
MKFLPLKLNAKFITSWRLFTYFRAQILCMNNPFRNRTSFLYGVELLAPRPTHKVDDHPLSAICDCLFDVFAATLHIGARSSSRNLRTRQAGLKVNHLSRSVYKQLDQKFLKHITNLIIYL